MPNQKPDHTVVFTGGTSGIGRQAAAELLRQHPTMHLLILVRGGRGPGLATELAEETGNSNVSTISCDLAALNDVRAAADEIGRQLSAGEIPPLRGYVGNAGLQTSPTRASADGFEMMFAVNVLANYLLLRLLLERFQAPARLIIVGSVSHFADFRHNLGAVPSFEWLGTEEAAKPSAAGASDSMRDGMRSYARSKLAVIYLVHALARRLPEGVDIYTYNPGAVPETGLAREASPAVQRVSRVIQRVLLLTPVAMDVRKAGVLLAEAAAGPRPGESGSYVGRGKVMRSSSASYDTAREEELWNVAARLCNLDTVGG